MRSLHLTNESFFAKMIPNHTYLNQINETRYIYGNKFVVEM